MNSSDLSITSRKSQTGSSFSSENQVNQSASIPRIYARGLRIPSVRFNTTKCHLAVALNGIPDPDVKSPPLGESFCQPNPVEVGEARYSSVEKLMSVHKV